MKTGFSGILGCLVLTLGFQRPAAAELYLVSAGNNLGHADEPALHYAEQDASRFAAVLSRLTDMPAQNAVLVLGEEAGVLRDVILDINARIRAAASSASDGATLMVFYSGHADAMGLHLGDTVLPFRELKNMVAGSPARVRLLIMDACRSGDVIRAKGAAPAGDFEITASHLETEGLAIIASSAAGEDSYESERLEASFFSHHLINALRGAADLDADGLITLDEAYQYTYVQTLRSSGRTREIQHPTYRYDLKGKGQLVLVRLVNDRNRSGRLWIASPGIYLVFEQNQSGRLAAEFVVGAQGTRLLLPAGSYFIQKRGRTHYLEYQLSLTAGEEIALDTMDHRAVEYARLVRKGGGVSQAVFGLNAMGAVRTGMLNARSLLGGAQVGASLDTRFLSFGLRGRYARGSFPAESGLLQTTHSELGLGLIAQKFVDLRWLSLGMGLLVELTYHWQTYRTEGAAPDRTALSLGFGALLSVELALGGAWAFLVEGGPVTHVFRRVISRTGAPTTTETEAALTGELSGGIVWRF